MRKTELDFCPTSPGYLGKIVFASKEPRSQREAGKPGIPSMSRM